MSNCLIYAIRKWIAEGGYILMRMSYYGWWPHFLHMSIDKIITHYSPMAKVPRLFPPIIFRGRVFMEDEPKPTKGETNEYNCGKDGHNTGML